MDIVLVTSNYSEVCRRIVNDKVFEKIPVKYIQVVDEYTRLLLKKNNITKIPMIFIKSQNNDIQKIYNLSNILEFMYNYNLKIISEYKRYNTIYVSPKSLNFRNYDIVITQSPSKNDNILRVNTNDMEDCIDKIYERLSEYESKPLILLVCNKDNILIDIVTSIYMYKYEEKHSDEILETIDNRDELLKYSAYIFK